MLLAKRNYKVYADIGYGPSLTVRQVAALDTGAGPNFIRKDELPATALSQIRHTELPRVTDANRNPIRMRGAISLTARLGKYLCKVDFLVAERLAVPVLLGADFCDRFVEAIHPRKRVVELADGSEVPIIRRPPKRLPGAPPLPASQDFVPAKGRVSPQAKSAEGRILAPHTHTWVRVTSACQGLRVIQPSDRLLATSSITVANGVVHVEPNIPFRVLIANMGAVPYRLSKNQVVATLLPHPTAIIPTEVTLAEVLGIEEPEGDKEPTGVSSNTVAADGTRTQQGELEPETAINQVQELDLSHLAPEYRERVRGMLKEFAPMWAGDLGQINTTEHHIDLVPGSRPVAQQPYRAGPKARELEQREVDKMLREGVIEPSQSEWASPVVMVPKPDGTLRFCVDYRRLNAMTARDSYPLPRMDECIDSLGTAKIFSTLDCNAGYWQLPVSERDRAKTAFVCHAGLYQYIRMPFGLKNAPASFQRTLDIILSGYKWKSCLVYLDDVIIYSNTVEDHMRHVKAILGALKAAGITLKFSKCELFTDTVKYLGHIIKPGTLSVDTIATKALTGAQHPRTQTELRSFLGLCNVYRRFVPGFAKLATPLNKLLRKGQPEQLEVFSESEAEAFKALISAVTAPPILALPKPGLPYSVDTDASNSQVGAALFQTQPDGERQPVGYWSRTLNSAELNYSTTEKECLAVVWALGTLRPYLQGESFIVHSDQASLRWLLEVSEPSGRLMRWRLRLSEFDFAVKYKKGTANTQADALSRLPTTGYTSVEVDEEIPCFTTEEPNTAQESPTGSHACPGLATRVPAGSPLRGGRPTQSPTGSQDSPDLEFIEPEFAGEDAVLAMEGTAADEALLKPVTAHELVEAQQSDDFCIAIRRKLNGGESLPFEVNNAGLLVRHVERNPQVIVPPPLRPRILYIGHHAKLAGAPGGRKLYMTLRRDYYWPTMALDCYATVRNCAECAKNRLKLRRNAAPLKLFPATRPLESVSIDILGELIQTPRGNRYLLVICDRFTKLVRTVPLRRITTLVVAKAFVTHWVFVYGPPAELLSDNGKQFAARLFLEVCRVLGIKNKFTTTYHPQCNGQVERFNRTILAALRHFVADHPKEWDLFSDALTYAYNTQSHASTGLAPFELVLSKPPRALTMEELPTMEGEPPSSYRQRWLSRLKALMETAKTALEATQRRYQKNFDSRLRLPKVEPSVGAYVFLRKDASSLKGEERHKLATPALGPYKVIAVDGKTLVLEIGDTHEKVSRDRVEIAPPPANEICSPALQPSRQEPLTIEAPNGLLDLPEVNSNSRDEPPTGIWTRNALQRATRARGARKPRAIQATREPNIQAEGTNPEITLSPNGSNSRPTRQIEEPDGAQQDRGKSKTLGRKLPPGRAKLNRVKFRLPLTEAVPESTELETANQARAPRNRHQSRDLPGRRSTPERYEDQEFIIDRLVAHRIAEDGTTLYQIRWYGYSQNDDTIQPIGDIPRSKVVEYCRRRRLELPHDLENAIAG